MASCVSTPRVGAAAAADATQLPVASLPNLGVSGVQCSPCSAVKSSVDLWMVMFS